MEFKSDIRDLLIISAVDNEEVAENFLIIQHKLGREHPNGVEAYFTELIFNLKKNIQGNFLGANWIHNDFPDIFSDHFIDHIINLLGNISQNLYDTCKLEFVPEENHKKTVLKVIKEHYISPFFEDAVKIRLLKEELGLIPDVNSKLSTLRDQLTQYNFFELPKVSSLIDVERLLTLLANAKVPYIVAMLDYLGFIDHLLKAFTLGQTGKANKIISDIFGSNIETVKRNRYSLIKTSKIDRERYTAHAYMDTVKTDYLTLSKN